MCLYPKLIDNAKYKPNKKNKGIVPECKDERVLKVPVGCGNCIECRTQKANSWKVRLNEECRKGVKGAFVTLTFNDSSLRELEKAVGVSECNAVATLAVRRFLERWRKKFGKSLRHWFITELGHTGTERIHLHGIVWDEEERFNEIKERWGYGYVHIGYVNERTVNYVVKYMTKIDQDHKGYKAVMLCSAGLGDSYMKRSDTRKNRFRGEKTDETYRLKSGACVALPIYYRNKLYTEDERELLWLQKLDKQEIYVRGEKVDISTDEGMRNYFECLKWHRGINRKLGYGDDSKDWNSRKYNTTIRQLNAVKKRLKSGG